MSDAGDQRAISGWLRRFRWSLAGVPSPEREDIVAEVQAHVAERVAAGGGVTETLNAFGRPEAYARSFVEEMELAKALTTQGFPSMLGVIARQVHRSALALAAFLVVLMLGGLAAGVAMTAVLELTDPVHAGLWIGRGSFFFGKADDADGLRELLGGWILPLAPALLALSWVLGRLVLLSALRTIRTAR